ncbi:bifunctional 5,10-methylenetetrahydrofolate dehydrogenase/5,10-methenyltetrahydrofolate cyclohydrolase [Sporanaerobacter acetigenes]|uniref:Bifunctional protein FolD n=1 Tax=Sporanaerobacter acetigenes DSM 13106 TaxID=1123281 RepID=A0A1M5UN40_9FIRM|nr:bifunctional 5,10-methylenetetrahydrofolate dehydrogenase/5,10-methenyltetrahydrofolate cyclohydrolase [Sporanaerobacter acetigenes]SHH64288.1 methenyltetrahydrofolate cyclohydrolase [Sporanaerobacter acetigenes DSM 13106]
MADILSGKEVAKNIKENIKKEVVELNNVGISPTLGILRVGQNSDDIAYEKSILKNCDSVGIVAKVYELEESISTEGLLEIIEKLNQDMDIHGILIFRPLPKHIDEEQINNTISSLKDVDCMNPLNLEKVFEGDMDGFAPCTPKAAMKIMEFYDIPLEGAKVSVVNRSMVVGKPLSMMLLGKNATVTICHSRTKDLKKVTKSSDIVVTALGRAKYFDEGYFNENSVIIDVGISLDKGGNISGDVDFDNVNTKVKSITPVPGGVGSVTTSILLGHVVVACKHLK